MPGVSGKECLLMLKHHSKYSTIPVVMLSTSCPTGEVDNYRSMGAFDCIQKPTQFQELVKIFAKFIFGSR
jgi:DNA-binding response OmpR family regulator